MISAKATAGAEFLTPQECSNLAWSFAKLDAWDAPMMAAVAERSIETIEDF